MEPIGSRSNSISAWHQGRGGPARTGHATGSDPTAEPDDHWTFATGSMEVSTAPVTVTVDGQSVTLVGSWDGLHAIDDVGGEYWSSEFDDTVGGTPAIADGADGPVAYVPCIDDTVYAIDVETG